MNQGKGADGLDDEDDEPDEDEEDEDNQMGGSSQQGVTLFCWVTMSVSSR